MRTKSVSLTDISKQCYNIQLCLFLQALERFQENVYDLYTAQRIPNPVWLTMVASPTNKTHICDQFLREFSLLIERYDTKSTNQ